MKEYTATLWHKQCPVCAANLVHEFGDGYNYYDCTMCHLRCDEKHLLKITAAIDLARELVKLERCEINPEYHRLEQSIAQMEYRVIKVFGGE